MMDWFVWTPLELAANLTTALCIFLAGRNSVHTWWTGIIATILFGFLFFDAKLYADVTLQVFFVITGIIGWYSWVQKKHSPTGAVPLPITRVDSGRMVAWVAGALAIGGLYSMVLLHFTDAYAPVPDSLVLVFSVLGQLLLMRRKLETWPVWLMVNTIAVPLFWSRELYLTSVLYSAFWIHAVYAWYHWVQLEKKQ